jgi:uncharacterized protein (TIGR01568 family)
MLKKRKYQKKSKVPLSQWVFPAWQNSFKATELFQKCPSDPSLVDAVGSKFSADVDTSTPMDLSPTLRDFPRWSIGACDRFFVPTADVASRSLLEEARLIRSGSKERTARIHGSLMELNSSDPIEDFKISMEEMLREYHVERGEPLDWDLLEELLYAYLEVNERAVCRYIFAAFFDLTMELGHRPYA